MSANRIVTILTPVFTAVAALGSGYIAKSTGLNVSPAELLAVETTVGVSAAGAAIKWLHGWSVFEQAEQHAQLVLAEADKYGVKVPSEEEISKTVEKAVGEHLVKLAAAI